jgi:predicted transcriptional regulator
MAMVREVADCYIEVAEIYRKLGVEHELATQLEKIADVLSVHIYFRDESMPYYEEAQAMFAELKGAERFNRPVIFESDNETKKRS